MKQYFQMLRFLNGHYRMFGIAVAAMFLASFFEVFSLALLPPAIDIVFTEKTIELPDTAPAFAREIADHFNSQAPAELLPKVLIFLMIMFTVRSVTIYAYKVLMSAVSQRVIRDLRLALYTKIMNLSLAYFGQSRTGELVARITHDANKVENAVCYALIDLFRQSFTLIFLVSTAMVIDFQAALFIFIVFPLIVYPVERIGKRLRKFSRLNQEKFADMHSLMTERISGVQLIKVFCTDKEEVQRFQGINQDFYKLKVKEIKRLNAVSPLTEFIGAIAAVGLIFWFSQRMFNDEVSFGVFSTFLASFLLIISPLKKLSNVNVLIQQALAANERIYSILDAEVTVAEKPDAMILPPFQDRIRMEGARFSYNREAPVLEDIDLEIRRGEVVAIVGPTGTGKSTLVNLIPRLYDVTGGRVLIDGVDIRDVTILSLRQQIGIVTQDSILFNDTVARNIAYGSSRRSEQEIEEAARKAFAHRFIEKMPDGYNTVIGDRGFRLSGGEKQRLTIARAILKDPPILILDEATSQLDSESEKYVQEALERLMKGRTVLAIAHRLSTIRRADKIVVLEKGRVVGCDSHDNLLKTCPLYERLHRMQFSS